jgi:hypothetical protein
VLKKAKQKRRSLKALVAVEIPSGWCECRITNQEARKLTLTLSVERPAGARPVFLALLALGLLPGCMSQQLRLTALRTVNALPDLQYQQVIDNLAKLASNPGFLPYYAVAGQGSVQVTDNGSSTLGLNIPSQALGPGSLSFGASRNVTGTWSLGTITSPEKIRNMQAVYLRAIRGRAAGDPEFGWLKVGARGDVPKQVTYVGHYEDVFVWVAPAGIDGLSDLTLAIMDIATREDAGGAPVADSRPLSGTAGPPGISRRNFQVPSIGPLFTPGVP